MDTALIRSYMTDDEKRTIKEDLEKRGVRTSRTCICCPLPSGIYADVIAHVCGMISNLGSIVLVFKLGSSIVGLVLTLIYLRSAHVERSLCSSSMPGPGHKVRLRGLLGRCLALATRPVCNLLPKQVDFTYRQGVVSPRLRLALSDGAIKRTALLALLLPWATLEKASQQGHSISNRSAVFSIIMLAFSIKTLFTESMGAHYGGECRQFGMTTIRLRYRTWRSTFYIIATQTLVLSEVVSTCTLNAVVMLLLTIAYGPACGLVIAPLAGMALFLPGMLALYYILGHTGEKRIEGLTLWRFVGLSPLHWFTGAYSSLFRLPMYSVAAAAQFGNRPAYPMVIANICRVAMSLAIVCFRAAIVPAYGSLISGACISTSLYAIVPLDDVYTKCLLIGALISTPLYLILLVSFAVTQKGWSFGLHDNEHSDLDGQMLELIEVAGLFDVDGDL